MLHVAAAAFVLASVGQASGPLPKVKAFLNSKQLEATYSVAVSGKAFGTASLKIRRSTDLLFTMKAGEEDYALVITPRQVRELERSSKHYHEFRPIGRLLIPPSEISPTQGFMIADWVLLGDIASMLPPGFKTASKGKAKVGNRDVEHTQITYDSPMASGSLDLMTDAEGRPWEARWRTMTPTGVMDYKYTFTSWSNAPKFTDATFRLDIPVGFVPAFVKDPSDPATVDEYFPATTWKTASGTADPLKLAAGSAFLLILGAEQCDITPRAKGLFGKMAQTAQAAKVKVFYGTLRAKLNSPALVPGVPHLRDESGSAAKALRIQATPMVFLVDKSGVLRRAWMGYDAKKDAVVLKELAQGIELQSKSR